MEMEMEMEIHSSLSLAMPYSALEVAVPFEFCYRSE